jgi:hypothetical protein
MSVGNQVESCGFTETGYPKRPGAIAANRRTRLRSVTSIKVPTLPLGSELLRELRADACARTRHDDDLEIASRQH